MTRFKALALSAAMTVATLGFAGTANAADILCTPAVSTCTFDGTTGGIIQGVAKGATVTNKYYFTVADAGTFTFNWTTSKISILSADFNGGTAFAPVFGSDYTFTVAAAGTYYLEVTGKNGTSANSTFVTSADFAAVPEPAAWGMMIGGFGLAGMAMRTRKKVAFAA